MPTPTPDLPQDHLRFIRLNCRESENLYLCDEILALLGTSWDEASQKIAADSSRFGDKAGKLVEAPTWDRKRHDVKDVIEEVATILDAKNLHWTVRVGVAIGRSVPSGQLRDCLGADVLSALWSAT